MNKEVFLNVLEEIDIPPESRKGAITPEIKLAVTLQLLSGGNYQSITGTDIAINISQSTVSSIFKDTLQRMEDKLCPKYIKFETTADAKEYFYDNFKLPSVVGCIDGTLIFILRPNENEHDCYSRKGRHAINAMIVIYFLFFKFIRF